MKEDLAKEKGRESSHIYSLTMSWQRPLQYLEDGLQDVHFIVHKVLGREYSNESQMGFQAFVWLQIALQLVQKNGMSYFAPNMIVLHCIHLEWVEEMLAERVLHRWMA